MAFQTERSRLRLFDDFLVEGVILPEAHIEYDKPFNLMGRECHMHRGIALLSNVSKGYKFSNQMVPAQPLTSQAEEYLPGWC